MPLLLTEEQMQAVDAAIDAPARVVLPGDREATVLLPADDFAWLQKTLPDVPEMPLAADPGSQRSFALMPLSIYERYRALFEEDPITPEERQRLLHEFGLRAGWDDPNLDVYEEYRKRP